MFGWISRLLGGGQLAALQAEVAELKAAAGRGQSPLAATGGLGSPSPDLGRDRERLNFNRGWVHSCVRAISQRVAGQAVRVGKLTTRRAPGSRKADDLPAWIKSQGREVEPLPDHPLLKAMEEPNEVLTGWHLLYLTAASLELTGKSYWWLDTGEDGRTVIWPLPSPWVRPLAEGRWFSSYEIRVRNSFEAFTLPGESVIRFALPDPADPLGALPPLQAQAKAVVADESIQECQRRAFENGLWPGLIVRVAKNQSPMGGEGTRPVLTAEQRAQILHAVKQRLQGVGNYGEPLIVDGMLEDIDAITRTPQEMAFLESGQTTKSRICQGFGVSPIILGEVEGANRASATVADEHFTANTVNPLLTLLSQTATAWFRYHFSDPSLLFWVEPARPHDEESERARMTLAVRGGVVRRNELRAFAGLPALPGADGEELVAPAPGNGGKAKRLPFRGKGTEEGKHSKPAPYLGSAAHKNGNGNGRVHR